MGPQTATMVPTLDTVENTEACSLIKRRSNRPCQWLEGHAWSRDSSATVLPYPNLRLDMRFLNQALESLQVCVLEIAHLDLGVVEILGM